MKDAYGTELSVGDHVVHGLKLSSSIKLTKRTVIVAEEKRAKTEWVDSVFYVVWDTPSGKWKNGADVKESGYKDVIRRTWISTPQNVVRVG